MWVRNTFNKLLLTSQVDYMLSTLSMKPNVTINYQPEGYIQHTFSNF
jgi:hypothetical protein